MHICMCLCASKTESRTPIVEKQHQLYKRNRDVLKMRNFDEFDMGEFTKV